MNSGQARQDCRVSARHVPPQEQHAGANDEYHEDDDEDHLTPDC